MNKIVKNTLAWFRLPSAGFIREYNKFTKMKLFLEFYFKNFIDFPWRYEYNFNEINYFWKLDMNPFTL